MATKDGSFAAWLAQAGLSQDTLTFDQVGVVKAAYHFRERYLSAAAQDSPREVLALIKRFVRSSRQRALMPATLLPRLAAALAGSGFLNEAGEQLASQEAAEA